MITYIFTPPLVYLVLAAAGMFLLSLIKNPYWLLLSTVYALKVVLYAAIALFAWMVAEREMAAGQFPQYGMSLLILGWAIAWVYGKLGQSRGSR